MRWQKIEAPSDEEQTILILGRLLMPSNGGRVVPDLIGLSITGWREWPDGMITKTTNGWFKWDKYAPEI